jgi:hypothetical protein
MLVREHLYSLFHWQHQKCHSVRWQLGACFIVANGRSFGFVVAADAVEAFGNHVQDVCSFLSLKLIEGLTGL